MINCIIGSLLGTCCGLVSAFYIIRLQLMKDIKRDTKQAFEDGILYGATAIYVKNEI